MVGSRTAAAIDCGGTDSPVSASRPAADRAAKKLAGMKADGDEQIGIDIIKRACEEPIRQIVNNAGVEGASIIGKIRENDNARFGYNAQTDVYEDLGAFLGADDPDGENDSTSATALRFGAVLARVRRTLQPMGDADPS